MSWTVRLSPEAERKLRHLKLPDRTYVQRAIDQMETNPFVKDATASAPVIIESFFASTTGSPWLMSSQSQGDLRVRTAELNGVSSQYLRLHRTIAVKAGGRTADP